MIDFARVRLGEPDDGVWECPVFLEVGIQKASHSSTASTEVVGGDGERGRKKRGEEAEEEEKEEKKKTEGEEEDTIQLASPVHTPSSTTLAGYLGLARDDERHGG